MCVAIRGVGLLLVAPLSVAAQQPSPTDIAMAIRRGTVTKSCEIATKGKAFGTATGFDFSILGPLNRIECTAAAATKRYLPFSTEEATAQLRGNQLEVVAEPIAPIRWSNGTWHITPAAKHVVLFAGKGEEGATAIQPDSIELVPAEWGNAMGGKFQSEGIRAWFANEKIPAGEFTVTVITAGDEYRFRLGKRERRLVR